MNYVKLIFDLKKPEDADLISAILSEVECQGFEEKDDKLFSFLYEANFDEAQVNELLSPFGFTYIKEIIPHENWNAQWESNFEPIRINHEVGLRADFHPPFQDCRYDIVITPKMSFGTGHHETTQMMLEYACEINFENKSVLDFGCGTGVLAIFASLKGAQPVLGIDNDAWSIENAKENCIRNGCDQVEISISDIESLKSTYDIILANINLNVLLQYLPTMKKLLNAEGNIFMSGVLISDLPALTESFSGLGFKLISQKQKKDWIALHIN